MPPNPRDFMLDALALLWPVACVACGVADRELCAACRAALHAQRTKVIDVRAPSGVRVRAAGAYEDPVRAVLLAYKHQGMTGLAKPLAGRLIEPLLRAAAGECSMADSWMAGQQARRLEARAPEVVLIAAPSRRARVRERGYHHIELLVSALLRELRSRGVAAGFRAFPHALRTGRGRTAQVGLTAVERERNAARVTVRARARSELAGASVVLIDDVVTTGATARAAIEALDSAGARVLGTVALCVVRRRDAELVQHGEIQVETR